MCSGGGMVVTSFGPKPCPTCGGGGVIYSESDYEDYESEIDDGETSSGGSGGGGGGGGSYSSYDNDYDSSSYDTDSSYSSPKTKREPMSYGSILFISIVVAIIGFMVSGKPGLLFGLGAFITFVVGRK